MGATSFSVDHRIKQRAYKRYGFVMVRRLRSQTKRFAGVSTLKPLSYEAFRKAYVQPSMRDVAQDDTMFMKSSVSTSGK